MIDDCGSLLCSGTGLDQQSLASGPGRLEPVLSGMRTVQIFFEKELRVATPIESARIRPLVIRNDTFTCRFSAVFFECASLWILLPSRRSLLVSRVDK